MLHHFCHKQEVRILPVKNIRIKNIWFQLLVHSEQYFVFASITIVPTMSSSKDSIFTIKFLSFCLNNSLGFVIHDFDILPWICFSSSWRCQGYKTDGSLKGSILVIVNNKIYIGLGIKMNDIMIEASENRDVLLMTTNKSWLKSVWCNVKSWFWEAKSRGTRVI